MQSGTELLLLEAVARQPMAFLTAFVLVPAMILAGPIRRGARQGADPDSQALRTRLQETVRAPAPDGRRSGHSSDDGAD